MESSKRRTMIKTIGLCTKDVFRTMPGITICTLILRLITAATAVALVKLFAVLTDSAANVNDRVEDMFHYAFLIIACYLINVLCDKISYHLNNIDSVPKFEIYHHRLSDFTVSLSLEAAEDPVISSKFWRAKDAVYQDRMGSVWSSVYGIIPKLFQLIGTALVLFDYYPGLVLLALLSILPSFLIRMIIGGKQYQLSRNQTEKNRLSSYLWGVLTNRNSIKEMRCMGFSEYLTKRYFDVSKEVFEENKRFDMKSSFRIFIGDFIKVSFYGISICICIWLLNNDVVSLGAFVACLSAFTAMQTTSESLLTTFSALKQQCNYANDYYDFFDLATEKNSKEECLSFENTLKTDELVFRYPNSDRNAIDSVDFSIHKGEKIAIVGENGSGKTTLVKLLLGLFTPTSGTVEMDDKNIMQYNQSYYKRFSMVAQRFGKYNISLRDNIAFGDLYKRNDNQKLNSACKDTGVNEIVEEMGGYDVDLGVEFGGRELSGGQWQKVAITRGVFRGGEIFFLDEPTSALDPIIEYDVLSDFIKTAKDNTAVIISHRIGICTKVDKIVLMSHGKIAEVGNHKELLKKNGLYASMWHEQAKWYQEGEYCNA